MKTKLHFIGGCHDGECRDVSLNEGQSAIRLARLVGGKFQVDEYLISHQPAMNRKIATWGGTIRHEPIL